MNGNEILGWGLVYIWSFALLGLLIYVVIEDAKGGKKKLNYAIKQQGKLKKQS